MEKLYVSVYCEDCFRGISIKKELESIINNIKENTYNVIDEVFTDYNEYRDYEVEISHYAKDISMGTKEISNINELMEYFKYSKETIGIIKKYFLI